MATKTEKCQKRVNAAFSDKLAAAFHKRFNRELHTTIDLGSLNLVSRPADGRPFTRPQKDFVQAWSDGYGEALGVLWAMVMEEMNQVAEREQRRMGQ